MKLHCIKYQSVKTIEGAPVQIKRRRFDKNNTSLQREFFDQLAKKLDIRHIDDWTKITNRILLKNGGSAILRQYGNLVSALSSVFPHESWKFWLFNVYDPSYWEDRQNHRRYFDWLEQKLNIQHKDDWYRIPSAKVRSLHGNLLLSKYYNNRLTVALPAVYPEHNWQPWKFGKVGKGFWDDERNIVSYVRWLQDQLGIRNLEEWGCIPLTVLRDFGIGHLINRHGSIYKLLKIAYPNVQWGTESNIPKSSIYKFGVKSKSEYHFSRVIHEIFPQSDILTNHRFPNLVFPGSQREMEFDIFIPEHKLALEYQGQQHYVSHYLNGRPEDLQARDILKSNACQQEGITYIPVPFWWDRKKSSLVATLLGKKPSLKEILQVEKDAAPIPETIPETLFKQWQKYVSKNVFTFKEQASSMFGTPITSDWTEGVSPIDWLVYNPMDVPHLKEGTYLTVFWNGQFLKDMSGNTFEPSGQLQQLPKLPLYGLVRYAITVCTSPKRSTNNQELTSLKDLQNENELEFITLDSAAFRNLKFDDRIASLKTLALNIWEPIRCTTVEQLLQIYASVEESNLFVDDALHLRKPSSYFLDQTTYKLLRNYEEVEGTVIATGNNNITCKISNGVEVTIPTSKQVEKGSLVTIRHRTINGAVALPVLTSARKSSQQHQRVFYRLAIGQTFGILPKCKACKKSIPRKSLRIEAHGTFATAESGPQPAKYTLCPDIECIKNFTMDAAQSEGVGVFLPPFEGLIGIPEGLRTEFSQQRSNFHNLDHVQWIDVQ